MKAYPVADAAEDQYRGSGAALVAIAYGQAVAIAYLRDILPGNIADEPAAALDDFDDERLLPTAIRLSSKGDVIAAMCSSWEVVELAPFWPAANAAVAA